MMYVMMPLHMAAVLICILVLAWRFRITLVEALPVFTCGLVLVLYLLAFLRHLSWIDGIAVLVLGLFVLFLARMPKEERQDFIRTCRYNMTRPSFIAGVILLAAVVLCTQAKMVTWWDDFNFWAVDARALYHLDGFAGKYGNVAPAYGDYPPGTQVIKWWFLHFDPREFREGLAFAGYYCMNLVFLLPLLKKEKGKNILVPVLMAAALWFIPGIAEYFGYAGFCADLTMACIYGAFLYAVTDTEAESSVSRGCEADLATERSSIFYYGRLGLYLSVLVLVKSIGFVWALFGLVFFLLYHHSGESREGRKLPFLILPPMITGGTWMLFCLLMRRVANSTTTAVKYVVTDEYGFSGYMREYAAAFLQAFFGSPMHREKTFCIDMTPLGCYLVICLLCLLFRKAKLFSAKLGRAVLGFCMVSGALFYGIIFIAHITIFAGETQYLEASAMVASIERYGVPFTIGTLLFLAQVWLSRGERLFDREKMPQWLRRYGPQLCFLLFVALTTNYQIGYDGLVGYRNGLEEVQREREGYLDGNAEAFLEAVKPLNGDPQARVYYLREAGTPPFHNVYTSYLAAPVSVVHSELNLDDAPTDWMMEQIAASHASYLYVEESAADENAVFDSVTQGETFSCGVLYQITEENGHVLILRNSGDHTIL